MQYTVGEMAKRLHVAPSTLRYYDKEGLLPFWSAPVAEFGFFRIPILNGCPSSPV